MSLRSQSGKRTVIIQTKWSTKSNCGVLLSEKCFALCTNEMINAHSKTNRIQNDAGQYETFSFWFFDFEQCHLLDKCGIWPCYFVPTLGNLPLRWLPIVFCPRACWFQKSRDGASFQTPRQSRARDHSVNADEHGVQTFKICLSKMLRGSAPVSKQFVGWIEDPSFPCLA